MERKKSFLRLCSFILSTLYPRSFHCSILFHPLTRTAPSELRPRHMCISAWTSLEKCWKALNSWPTPSSRSLLPIGLTRMLHDMWANMRGNYCRSGGDGGSPPRLGTQFGPVNVPDKPPVNTAPIVLVVLVNSYEPTYGFVCHFFVDLRDKQKIGIAVFRSGP